MSVYQIANDKAVTAGGIAAATSYIWMPWLQEASSVAALLLPIFGVGLLILQGVLKVRTHIRGSKD